MTYPKINFVPMTLEENIAFIKWAYFAENNSLDIHQYTIKCFPELQKIDSTYSKEEIEKKIEVIVREEYLNQQKEIELEVKRYNKIWSPLNDSYFEALTSYLKVNFPQNLKEIKASIGILPVFPRDLDSFSFALGKNLSNSKVMETCAHETCHFLWFEKWKELYPQTSRKEYEAPYLPWQYSEMVTDPILNSAEIQKALPIKEKAYDSFYSIKDSKNNFIMEELRKIYKENIPIENRIRKGYQYIRSVLGTMKKECAYEIGVFVMNEKNQILLQKRSAMKKHNPNKWALCHGHVEVGESVEEAAMRELKEELGIKISALHPLATIENSPSHITYYFYTRQDKKKEEFILQKEEVAEVAWFDINEVINKIKNHDEALVYGEDKIALFEKLQNILKGK